MKDDYEGFVRRLVPILVAVMLAVTASCTLTDPVKTEKSKYYVLDTKVTAADAGLLKFGTDCKVSPATSVYCTPANPKKIADATTALGTAMDGYSAVVRDPNASVGGLQQAAAVVNAALATVTALIAQFGVKTP